ncbi:MAG: glycosyl hydrolase family 28-related protein [Victivallales bacterium]
MSFFSKNVLLNTKVLSLCVCISIAACVAFAEPKQQPSGPTKGAWGDKANTKSLSVSDFGAVGDGVTDDTAAIQAAVSYAAGASTKIIFPLGTFKVTSQINIPVDNTRMLEIDGCGASILPAIGSSGSVFRASNRKIDYQSSITIKNFVVTSTISDHSNPTPLQARSFVEFNGGGFINATVEKIQSNNTVTLGAVVWFSDVNYGFADGITVQNINVSYGAHVAFIVAITRRPDGSDDPRTHSHDHSRFINLFNASNSGAVDFGSWEKTVTYASGEQGCILLDGVTLSDSHIGPWCIGNPHVILGKNGAIIFRSIIEGSYNELYQKSSVVGPFGAPVSIKCDLESCIVQTPRQYFDALSFAKTAHIYVGKAVNTKFEKPGISKVGAPIAAADRFIVFSPGSYGNYVDAFCMYSYADKKLTDTWSVHPSQLVQGPAGAAKYNNFREANLIQPSAALGTSFSKNGDFLLATIPAYNLNSNDVITIRGSALTAGAKGSSVRMSASIDGTSSTTPAMKIDTTAGNEVFFELNLRFTGSTDKTFAPKSSYWGSNKAERAGSVIINTNGGNAIGPVDIVNKDMQIWLHTSDLVDAIKLTGLTIEHKSGNFQSIVSRGLPDSPVRSLKTADLAKRLVDGDAAQVVDSEKISPDWVAEHFLVSSAPRMGINLDIPADGTYQLSVGYIFGGDFGDVEVSVDGKSAGHLGDLEAQLHGTVTILPKPISLPKGRVTMSFEQKGGKRIGLIFVQITPVLQDIAAKQWMVIGPFIAKDSQVLDVKTGRGMSDIYPPEVKRDFDGSIPLGDGKTTRWQAMAGENDFIDLGGKFKRTLGCISYAVTHIYSPKVCTVRLAYEMDYWMKLWLNGKIVQDHTMRDGTPIKGQFTLDVELQPGWNELLLKVSSGSKGNGFWMSINNPGDLRFSPKPETP